MERNYLAFLEEHSNKIGNTIGLSNQEIQNLEKSFNVQFPLAYKQFLGKYGKDSGKLMQSYYMCYPALKENREDAIYELNFDDRKKERIKLDDNIFFFAQWQGYNFFFFKCDVNEENPSVYLFDTESIKEYKSSFTDFLKYEGLKPLLEGQA